MKSKAKFVPIFSISVTVFQLLGDFVLQTPTRAPPRVGFGAHVCYHCRISPPRFLAECRKRRLNQGSFVLLYFNLSALFDLYLVFACLFSCTALFVSISQVIGCEDRLRHDLYCVGWGVKLYSLTHSLTKKCIVDVLFLSGG